MFFVELNQSTPWWSLFFALACIRNSIVGRCLISVVQLSVKSNLLLSRALKSYLIYGDHMLLKIECIAHVCQFFRQQREKSIIHLGAFHPWKNRLLRRE